MMEMKAWAVMEAARIIISLMLAVAALRVKGGKERIRRWNRLAILSLRGKKRVPS